MGPEQRHRFVRAALPYAILAALSLGGVAGLAWVKQARASSSSSAAPGTLPLAGATPESSASLLKRYADSCELAVRERRFDHALEQCQEFTESAELGGKAHASMAVASMLRGNGLDGIAGNVGDLTLSARHAEAAAKLNDPLGKMIWAYHGLNGHAATPVAPELAQTLLTEAMSGGVAKADLLLQSLKQSRECRAQARVALFEIPIFCMSRGELRGALTALGMREQEQSSGADREVFALGKMLPGAKQLSLQYAKQSDSQLLAPVQATYRFGMQEAAFANQTLQRLQGNLRKKYGPPAQQAQEGLGQWRSGDGVLIELRRDGAGDLLLSYHHEQRGASLREQTVALEARRAERLNSLTLKAL